MSKFILGNGLSGKIWKMYNPDFEIIGPVQAPHQDPFARSQMIWLHDCSEVRAFLERLGFERPEQYIKKSMIGYYDKGVIRDHLTQSMKDRLVKKKMTLWHEKEKIEIKDSESARMSLSSGEKMTNFMNVIDIDHSEIMKRLDQVVGPVTHGFVGEIHSDKIGITNTPPNQDSQYVYQKYSQLVSTIPAKMFWRAWQQRRANVAGYFPSQFESLPITFVNTKTCPKEFQGGYEMVYYDDSVDFTRISHLGDIYSLEFTGVITKSQFEEFYPELPVEDIWTLPTGRVVSQFTVPPKNTIFSGRFATHNHAVSTEDVIRQAMKYANNKKR